MIEWHGEDVMNEIGRRIDQNMLDIAQKVVTIAKTYAPVDTGMLRASIGFDYNLASHTLVFTVDAPYGIFQEYGTRNIRPHPYLRPALNTVGQIYGFNLEMSFGNIPAIHDPLLAAGPKFHAPKSLTAKQRAHVKEHLVSTSKRHWISNVSRTKMRVRRFQ